MLLAISDAGSGHTQLSRLLSAMNVPPIHHKSLKALERLLDLNVEEVAEASCREARREEANKEDATSVVCDQDIDKAFTVEPSVVDTELTASYDAAWQKRGTGHQYNSLTGRFIVQ